MVNKNENSVINSVKHIGLIMDGNRRWAKANGLDFFTGHKKGAETAKLIIKTAIEEKIQNLTLFAFSSENWKRPATEVEDLMELLKYFLRSEINNLVKNGIKLKILGDISLFPREIKDNLNLALSKTDKNNKLNLIIAINYGSRQEITNSIKNISKKIINKDLKIEDINENLVSSFLYTSGIPDPDLIIRTGGDSRLSNFLLWQSAYSELIFVDKPWPEFKKEDFLSALYEFKKRERRFGGC